jgi:hypothetical protein
MASPRLKCNTRSVVKRSTTLAAPSALPPLSASSTAALSSPGGSAPASSEVAISVKT